VNVAFGIPMQFGAMPPFSETSATIDGGNRLGLIVEDVVVKLDANQESKDKAQLHTCPSSSIRAVPWPNANVPISIGYQWSNVSDTNHNRVLHVPAAPAGHSEIAVGTT
jgi:hypothetical protein